MVLGNFGDGATINGETVTHAYLHPGVRVLSFVEVLIGARRHADDPVVLQETVTVVVPQVRAEREGEAFTRVYNGHDFLLDVSGWQLFADNVLFTFPDSSFIAAGDSVVVPFAPPSGVSIIGITAGGGEFPAETVAAAEPVALMDDSDTPIPGTVWIFVLAFLLVVSVVSVFLLRGLGNRG